jgi:ParB-like chromosome segregation protein Spo0J
MNSAKIVMKIELWPIDKPVPYARNARKIPQSAIDKVAGSLQEFGWQQPIVVDVDGVVVVGHVRLLAAKQLGEKKVPIHVASGLTPGQIKAFRLMDNRSHQESGWDVELLAPELAELQALNIDVSLTGFDAEEISKFLDPGSSDGKPPESFTEYDETIPTEHQCPKCGYTWSGAAAPKPEAAEEAA